MKQDDLTFPTESAARTIFVFQLDIDPARIDRWKAPDAKGEWPLPEALGVKALDASQVEVFAEEAIAEYGMVRYLTEANGMSAESVARDEAVLSALTGVIVMVHGKAVAGRDGQFEPSGPARFVGRYSEKVSLTASTPQPAREVTRGQVAGGTTEGRETRRFPWGILGLGLLGLIVLAAILWGLA